MPPVDSPPSRSGLVNLLLVLLDLMRNSTPPWWLLAATSAVAVLTWMVVTARTEQFAYMIRPGANISVNGYRLRAGSGPYWGRTVFNDRTCVRLETRFGSTLVPADDLIVLRSEVSGRQHLG